MNTIGAGRIGPIPPWPHSVLIDACDLLGIDPSGARLIKFTNNAVFALATTPLIVRIPGSRAIGDRVNKIVGVARWLAEHDMPSVRLVEEYPQPLTVGKHALTIWHSVEDSSIVPTGRDLGLILRRYHALPLPPVDLPRWEPINGIRRRIAEEDVLSADDHNFLERRCDEIEALLGGINYSLPFGPIHGDSFMGNLISGVCGPVICDFDSAALGPREWDLTPVAVGKLRFSYPTDSHEELAEAYGTDILQWRDFGVLRQLRELQLVTSVLPVLSSNPTLIDQWKHRFATLRQGAATAPWTPYR